MLKSLARWRLKILIIAVSVIVSASNNGDGIELVLASH